MTAEPIPFPASPYCRVRARVASIWADGPDDGTHPDWRPAAGEKVTLTPSIGAQLLTYDVGGSDPIIVTVERVECVVDEDGWLTKNDGRPVFIAPTDDPLMSAVGWTWTASIKGKSISFSAPSGGVVDLALFIAAPATDNTKTWVARIPELIDAAGNLVSIESVTRDGDDMVVTLTNGSTTRFPLPVGGGDGSGSVGVTADDAPAAPAEGQSASYLVSSAVTWPAGLVWSDDPDGGTAPTITGSALVSLFTVGGVTRAVMGATFPAPPDTTAPVAGTLAVVPSSTSALGTVTGASDAVALDAAPYSFRLDAGAWSAWQASASYTWTGLTASTAYVFQHRVRDAAGNITEGTAVTDTTDAPAADSTPPTAGTMAASVITSSSFILTVTGAADETALDPAPYAFSTDGGTTWTAYQASATYTATGLTAETAYDCVHKVRDAALNEATGTAIEVTTTNASLPSAGTILASDSFDRVTSSTTLGVADTGQTWNQIQGNGIGIVSGKAAASATANSWAVLDAGYPDVSVSATFERGAFNALIIRGNGYDDLIFARTGSTNTLSIYKRVGGTQTEVGTAYTHGLSSRETFDMEISATGTTITVKLNGLVVRTETITDGVGNTETGLILGGKDNTQGQADSFQVKAL